MGILKPKKPAAAEVASTSKRRSVQTDFANLKPLQPGGTIGFTGVRDEASPSSRGRNGKSRSVDDMDSDEDEEDAKANKDKLVDADGEDFKNQNLSPEDVKKQGELADGVKKIKVRSISCFPSWSSACIN